jgi:hypothetical protein
MNTAGVGICKAGSQSCIGTLGPCENQVVPAAQEDCFNDLDDDCDGAVNNGCPDTVGIGTAHALAPQGNPNGGGPQSARCPAGQMVGKVEFFTDNRVNPGTFQGVQVYCVGPTLSRGGRNYTLGTTALPASPSMVYVGAEIGPTDGGGLDCTVQGGFGAGFVSSGYASTTRGVLQLGLTCASATATLQSNNKLNLVTTADNRTVAVGFTTGGTAFVEPCATGEVLIGYDGRLGNWMDQVAPVCAPLVVTYK